MSVFRCGRSLYIRSVVQRLGSTWFAEIASEANCNQGYGSALNRHRISVFMILVQSRWVSRKAKSSRAARSAVHF